MILKKILLPVLVVAIISGCDSSSESSEIPIRTLITRALSGKVAEGCLRGANVCLDLNTKKICDPSAASTAGGVLSHYCCI